MQHLYIGGEEYQLRAEPYHWGLGVGVQIDIVSTAGKLGCVRVLCPKDDFDFDALAAMPTHEFCRLALARLANDQLPVTLELVMECTKDWAHPVYTSWSG